MHIVLNLDLVLDVMVSADKRGAFPLSERKTIGVVFPFVILGWSTCGINLFQHLPESLIVDFIVLHLLFWFSIIYVLRGYSD